MLGGLALMKTYSSREIVTMNTVDSIALHRSGKALMIKNLIGSETEVASIESDLTILKEKPHRSNYYP